MIPYVLVYFIVGLFSKKIKKDKWSIFDFLILIILIAFAGFRFGIGTDYSLYEIIYKNSYNLSSSVTNRTGYGFSIICNYFNTIGISYKTFIFLCSFITVLAFYLFFKKNSNNPGLSILLYLSLGFYTSSFNGFRQMLSIAFLLIGVLLMQKNKKFLSVISYLISFSIHSSSLLAIIIYNIFLKFKAIKVDFKKVFPLFFLVFLLYNSLFYKIIVMFSDYSIYLDYESTAGIGTYLIVFTYIFVFTMFIYPNRKEISSANKNGYFFINLLTIGICIMLIQLRSWLFARLAIYFTIFAPINLAEYYQLKNIKHQKINSLIFYVAIFIYYLVYVYSFGGVYPYNSIFFI